MSASRTGSPAAVPAQPGAGAQPAEPPAAAAQDAPVPDGDPAWRLRHLPMLVAISAALMLCAASAGLLVGGPTAALGAAGGVLLVTISFTVSTLVVAWADAVRPALLMPLGLLTYVIKYTLLSMIMLGIGFSGWAGGRAVAWGMAGGAVLLTVAQVWWVSRLARMDAARADAGSA